MTALRYDEEAKSKYSGSISCVILPASVTEVDREFFVPYWNLAKIEAAPENTAFAGVEGVLFTKDMKTLIYYPFMKKDSEYRIPDGVEELEEKAFSMNRNLPARDRKLLLRAVQQTERSGTQRGAHRDP